MMGIAGGDTAITQADADLFSSDPAAHLSTWGYGGYWPCDDGNHTLDVYGDINATGDSIQGWPTVTQAADGDFLQSSTDHMFGKYIVPLGVTAHRLNNCLVRAAEIHGTLTATSAWHRLIVYPFDDDCLEITGTVTGGEIKIVGTLDGGDRHTNAGNISGIAPDLWFDNEPGGSRSFVFTGRIECAKMEIKGNTGTQTIVMSGGGHIANLTLGVAGSTKHGALDIANCAVRIDKITRVDDADSGSGIAMHSGVIEAGGDLDFDGLAVTADGDDLAHIVGVGAPTIDNFACNYLVHAHNCVDGATNDNNDIDFDACAAPGSLALCGAGI